MRRYWSVIDLARLLGYSRQTIYDKIHKNEIPHVKMGRLLRFIPEEIERWILQNRSQPCRNRKEGYIMSNKVSEGNIAHRLDRFGVHKDFARAVLHRLEKVLGIIVNDVRSYHLALHLLERAHQDYMGDLLKNGSRWELVGRNSRGEEVYRDKFTGELAYEVEHRYLVSPVSREEVEVVSKDELVGT